MSTHNTLLEYMTTTKIGEKGQLTVPKQFREDLGLGIGAPFAVLRLGDGLILLPEQRRFEQLCERVRARLTAAGLTPEEILATIPEAVSYTHLSWPEASTTTAPTAGLGETSPTPARARSSALRMCCSSMVIRSEIISSRTDKSTTEAQRHGEKQIQSLRGG